MVTSVTVLHFLTYIVIRNIFFYTYGILHVIFSFVSLLCSPQKYATLTEKFLCNSLQLTKEVRLKLTLVHFDIRSLFLKVFGTSKHIQPDVLNHRVSYFSLLVWGCFNMNFVECSI